ncbi:MAG TPA: hypothetical protein DC060_05330, partial [Gemmatimonadetes bacterium]|nr:hypothetical protein [Gemmatimonadota bacterium]
MLEASVHPFLRGLRTLRSGALAVLALCPGTSAGAQTSPVTLFDPSASLGVVERAERAYWEGDATASLRLLEDWLTNTPDDVEALWRAARASVALGIITNQAAVESHWYRNGMAHSNE